MAKKQWSIEQLREILGEPHTIGPRGRGESRGSTYVGHIRAVKVGTKELEPGEEPGWMEWDCIGGDPREQQYKAFLDVQSSRDTSLFLKRENVQQILANYLGCRASANLDDSNLWVMERVCHKHYPVLGESGD
jgi:hypothetical protein